MLQALTHFRLPRRQIVSRIPSPLPCLKVLEVFDAGSIVFLHSTKAWQKWECWHVLSASTALVLLSLSAGCRASSCSSGTPVSPWDTKLCHQERAVCGLTPAIFDIIKPLSEVMFGRKNRSVANQNWDALTNLQPLTVVEPQYFFCRDEIWQHQMTARQNDSVSYFKPTVICCCPKPQDEQRFVSSFCNYFFEYLTSPCTYKRV